MSDAHIRLEPADAQGIATLRLSKPGKMNALSLAMWRQLRAVFDAVRHADSSPRVIIVRGADREFAAGADIEEFPQFRCEPESLAAFNEDAGPGRDRVRQRIAPLTTRRPTRGSTAKAHRLHLEKTGEVPVQGFGPGTVPRAEAGLPIATCEET